MYIDEKNIRSLTVSVLRVLFEDGSKWEGTANLLDSIPAQSQLIKYLEDEELVNQFKLDFGNDSSFWPAQYKDIWLCTCGTINFNYEDKCHLCSKQRSRLLTITKNELDIEKKQRHEALFQSVKDSIGSDNFDTVLKAAVQLEMFPFDVDVQRISEQKERVLRKAQKIGESNDVEVLAKACELLESIPSHYGSLEALKTINQKIEDINNAVRMAEETAKKEQQSKTAKMICGAMIAILLITGVFLGVTKVIIPGYKYKEAIQLYENGNYESAVNAFNELQGYKDSDERNKEAKYALAVEYYEKQNYEQAQSIFESLGGYQDSNNYAVYSYAMHCLNNNKYNDA